MERKKRCKAVKPIRTNRGLIDKNEKGTIKDEIENLDRKLICVRWDSGIETYVFGDEIELLNAA